MGGRDENMTGSGIGARRSGPGDRGPEIGVWGLAVRGRSELGWMDMEYLVVCMIEGW